MINKLILLHKTIIVQWKTRKKDLQLFAVNRKIPDLRNAKEHNQSFIRKKNTKSLKQSEITTYQHKSFENPNIVLIKSVIKEHPKTSHKLYQ